MIVDVFLKIILFLVESFTAIIRAVLPNYTMPEGLDNVVVKMSYYYGLLDQFLPVSAIVGVILMTIFATTVLIVVKLVTWGLRRLPTQS